MLCPPEIQLELHQHVQASREEAGSEARTSLDSQNLCIHGKNHDFTMDF